MFLHVEVGATTNTVQHTIHNSQSLRSKQKRALIQILKRLVSRWPEFTLLYEIRHHVCAHCSRRRKFHSCVAIKLINQRKNMIIMPFANKLENKLWPQIWNSGDCTNANCKVNYLPYELFKVVIKELSEWQNSFVYCCFLCSWNVRIYAFAVCFRPVWIIVA